MLRAAQPARAPPLPGPPVGVVGKPWPAFRRTGRGGQPVRCRCHQDADAGRGADPALGGSARSAD